MFDPNKLGSTACQTGGTCHLCGWYITLINLLYNKLLFIYNSLHAVQIIHTDRIKLESMQSTKSEKGETTQT